MISEMFTAFLCEEVKINFLLCFVNASINSSGAHPSSGNRGAFANVISPGGGAFTILSQPGGWALAYPGATPGHLTQRVVERWLSLSGSTKPLLKTDLSVRD